MRKIICCSIVVCVVFFMSISVSYATGIDIYNDLGPTTFNPEPPADDGNPTGDDVYWYGVLNPSLGDELALPLSSQALTDITSKFGGIFGVGLSFHKPSDTEYVTFGSGSLDLTIGSSQSAISASSQGSYRNDGASFSTAVIGLPDGNFTDYYNAFYLFDLTSFAGAANSATLRIVVEAMGNSNPEVNHFGFGAYDVTTDLSGLNPIPEPATMLLFGTGLVGLAGLSIRRRKK